NWGPIIGRLLLSFIFTRCLWKRFPPRSIAPLAPSSRGSITDATNFAKLSARNAHETRRHRIRQTTPGGRSRFQFARTERAAPETLRSPAICREERTSRAPSHRDLLRSESSDHLHPFRRRGAEDRHLRLARPNQVCRGGRDYSLSCFRASDSR